jgi:hypothetical protein
LHLLNYRVTWKKHYQHLVAATNLLAFSSGCTSPMQAVVFCLALSLLQAIERHAIEWRDSSIQLHIAVTNESPYTGLMHH